VTARREPTRLRPDENVAHTHSRNRTFMLPDIVSARLDQVIVELDHHGVPVGRNELIAALLSGLEPDPSKIEKLLRTYRTARVSEVYRGDLVQGVELVLEEPGPGPRGRHRVTKGEAGRRPAR